MDVKLWILWLSLLICECDACILNFDQKLEFHKDKKACQMFNAFLSELMGWDICGMPIPLKFIWAGYRLGFKLPNPPKVTPPLIASNPKVQNHNAPSPSSFSDKKNSPSFAEIRIGKLSLATRYILLLFRDIDY